MASRFNKFVHTSHLTFSVGWFGAVAVFLVLAIAGITTENVQLARSAYLSMELSGWYVLVPFCFAALLTGLIESVSTKWDLVKYYWILVKLVLTLAATVGLLLHMQPIRYLANVAADPSFSITVLPAIRMRVVADAGAALLLLLAITTISVYKPWGKIQYKLSGSRERTGALSAKETLPLLSWKLYAVAAIMIFLLIVIVLHLFKGGMMGHHF